MAKTVFYARASTRDQNPSLQTDAAKQLGVKGENIFVEKASGSRNDRPVLARALAACEKGDTLACYKLDRIGRSLAHLTKLLADLEAGCWFHQPGGSVDFNSSSAGVSGEISRHSAVGVPAP
jgi:DNA invertase Pin-like site-specific DNA recombinase